MKIKVVCGILIWNEKVLVGKRKSTNQYYPSKWEFPGGKIEKEERIDETIIREFKEELDIEIYPFHEFRTISDDNIEMTPMVVKLKGGKAKLIEHDEVRFVNKSEFSKMDLTPLSKESGNILFNSYFIFLRKGE
jgi:8-oxo-dGTP diphosphatase